jgi:hypothetical protein
MAVTTEPAAMLELIRAGDKFCTKFTKQQKKLTQRFVGNFYSEGMKSDPAPENMLLTFQASILPQLCYDNPQVQVKAMRPITGGDVATWMQQGCNQWIKLRDIVDDLMRVAVESLYSYGVMKVGVEPWHRHTPEPGTDETSYRMQPHLPFLTQVPNTDYAFDPECKQWEYRRWEAMRLVRDLEDVQADESYDQAARAQVVAAYDTKGDKARLVPLESSVQTSTRVELWEVYYNETGQIGVLCETTQGGATWLRPLQKMQGPGSPYVLVGGYYVPGSPIPLSILAAVADQFNELNAHAAAASKEETNRKKIGIVNGDDDKTANSVLRARNGDVLKVKGFDTRMVANLEIGGTSAERLNYITALRDRLDRLMGQSDAIRGTANGDKTATEVSVAQDNASIRVQLLQRHWRRGVRAALEKVCWYLFNDPAVVFWVAYEDEAGQDMEGKFLGGLQPGQEDLHWTDYNLSVEPLSMQRVDPQRQAQIAQMTLDVAMAIAPMIPQFPWIKWDALLDALGEAHNIEGFAEMVLDKQALQQAMMLGMAPPIMPSQPASQGSVPGNANPQLQAMFGQGQTRPQSPGQRSMGNTAGSGMGMMGSGGPQMPMMPQPMPQGRMMAAVA